MARAEHNERKRIAALPPPITREDMDADLKQRGEDRREQERLASLAQARHLPTHGLATNGEMHPGERITFTAGKETFYPGRAVGFEVGPIEVSIEVQRGERTGDAYARAVTAAYVMFEAEFHQKRVAYFKRLAEVSK